MIPVVDQICDLEDIVANLFLLGDKDEDNNTAAWIGLILTAVGCIPILGSAVKGIFKIILESSQKASKKIILKALRAMGKGDPEKFLKNLDWPEIIKLTKETLINIFNKSIEALRYAVKKIPLMDELSQMLNKLEVLKKEINKRVDDFFSEMLESLDRIFKDNIPAPSLSGAGGNGTIRVKTSPEPNYTKMADQDLDNARRLEATEVEDGRVKGKVDEDVGEARKKVDERTDNVIDIDAISPLLKTKPNTAFFWSGRTNGVGGAEKAIEIAQKKGGTTLENLIDVKGIKMPEWDFSNPDSIKAWQDVSAEYAKQVSGEVHAVVGNKLRSGNVWKNVELPRLKKNTNVSKITVIDPLTLTEKIIFKR